MPLSPLTNDAAAKLLCRYHSGTILDETELHLLEKWIKASQYNKSVVENIRSDDRLRSILSEVSDDSDEFWTIVIKYRAGLHAGMSPRTGNFWYRMVRPVTRLFHQP